MLCRKCELIPTKLIFLFVDQHRRRNGGGAGGAAAPPTFQQEGLSPPNVHMLSLLFNVEPPQLLNHSYAYVDQ